MAVLDGRVVLETEDDVGWFRGADDLDAAQAPPISPGAAPDGSPRATFAAGCFWGVEDVFRQVPGVIDVVVGYTGGTAPAPSYEQVCGGRTGHAEAVLVTFDASQVSYQDLLEVFWRSHDPTTRDRQGPDVGSQYRSAIFAHDDVQLAQARESSQGVQARFARPIVTDIAPAGIFWPAEAYHQGYTARTGRGGCHVANW